MVQELSDIFQSEIRYKLCVHVCLSINPEIDNASWTWSIHCSDIFRALTADFSYSGLYIDNYSTLKKKKEKFFCSGVGYATQCYLRSKSSCYPSLSSS